MNRYFLDESGHGGDLASSSTLDFGGQPVFALACVGVQDEGALVAELDRLRESYSCGAGELKSSALGNRLPALGGELVDWLIRHDAAIFIELVEKRFFVTIHVINNLLCGRYGLDEVDQASRSQFAEFLNGKAFDPVLLSYMAACRSQSMDDIRAVLNLLWDLLDESDEDLARTLQILTMYARDDAVSSDAEVARFLPIPDENPAGKRVWMLPNLQCFTNIYGRINKSRPDGLDGVTCVHDVQLQYDKVLGDGKAMLETLARQGAMPNVPFADYRLRGQVTLAFATGDEEPCLQAADILAGLTMRFVRTGLPRGGKCDAALRDAFFQLHDIGNPFTAAGLNLGVSDAVLDHLQLPNVSAAPFVF